MECTRMNKNVPVVDLKPFLQEPLNEAVATKLHQRLGCQNYVSYSLLWENRILYSVCENFINTDMEFVSAVSINPHVPVGTC